VESTRLLPRTMVSRWFAEPSILLSIRDWHLGRNVLPGHSRLPTGMVPKAVLSLGERTYFTNLRASTSPAKAGQVGCGFEQRRYLAVSGREHDLSRCSFWGKV